MDTNLIHVGFGNMVAMNRVTGMVEPKGKHTKRLVEEARNQGRLITLTSGRRSKTAIFIDTGQIVLSALETTTIADRITNEEGKGAQHADNTH